MMGDDDDDDVAAFAKVAAHEEESASCELQRRPSAVRTNMVFHEQNLYYGGEQQPQPSPSPFVHLLAMNDDLAKMVRDFYKPSIPVRCHSDCNIWNFVSSTNKAIK